MNSKRFILKDWLATLSLGFSAFIFVTSEFIPVGLIYEIGESFHRTDAETAIAMTIYAWVVALLALPLTAYVSKFNRRPLMLVLLGIFVVAHGLTCLSSTFELFILSRLLVASCHAIFWAIAIPLGIRLGPKESRERAMTMVVTGATLGSVLGIPLGTYFGQLFGWRMTFGAIGLCAALIAGVLFKIIPSTPSLNSGNFKSIIPLMKRKNLVLVYLMTVTAMLGDYTVYSMITPFLTEIGGFKKELIASVLLMLGVAGCLGSFVAPHFLKKYFKQTALMSSLVVALCLIGLRFASVSYLFTLTVVAIWGFAFILYNLVLQHLVLSLAPDAEDVAMAGFSGIYNIGIGGGALIASIASVHHLYAIGYIGGSLVGVAILIGVYLLQGPLMVKMARAA